jgi:hypothetical protein
MSDKLDGADVHMANELVLCLVNDEPTYNQVLYVRGSLAKKVTRWTYDPVLAGRAWRYTVEGYILRYKREQGDVGRISVATRNLAGRLLEQNQREDVYAAAGLPEQLFTQADAVITAIESEG